MEIDGIFTNYLRLKVWMNQKQVSEIFEVCKIEIITFLKTIMKFNDMQEVIHI